MNFVRLFALIPAIGLLVGCSRQPAPPPAPSYFQVDPKTAGTLSGTIRFTGAKPAAKVIEMDSDADCARLHEKGRMLDESLVVNKNGTLANVFVYIKSGLEGKSFPRPTQPAVIDQKGCWFGPRMIGLQTGQTLNVTNSDPVTHNIHPLAQVNREWNQSQSQGDPPLARRFVRPEIMIPVKCNIHRWMRAWIGVVDHPYFAVTKSDGTFEIKDLPPGKYTITAWQEKFGSQDQTFTLADSQKTNVDFTFKGD